METIIKNLWRESVEELDMLFLNEPNNAESISHWTGRRDALLELVKIAENLKTGLSIHKEWHECGNYSCPTCKGTFGDQWLKQCGKPKFCQCGQELDWGEN